ncbi:MAG: hypothetical protein JXB13_21075 [Phycisphaerae bacterium]|nr:hypothetical protein [Phycisphaerae bacterium]
MSPAWKDRLDNTKTVVVFLVLLGSVTALLLWAGHDYPGVVRKGVKIFFWYVALPIYALAALIGLVAGGVFVYAAIIEPLHDRYLERKYKWARSRDPRFREWLARQVNVLRDVGFLTAFDDLSEKQRLTRIAARLNKMHKLARVVRHPCMVATIDEGRTLFVDNYDDERWGDAEGYAEFMAELAGISRGAFAPTDVSAEMSEDGKSARIGFRHNGTTHEVRVGTEDGCLDTEIIDAANRATQDSGTEFVALKCPTGQESYLVCLRSDERRRLEAEVGWRVE